MGEKVIIKDAPAKLQKLIGTVGIIRELTVVIVYTPVTYSLATTTTSYQKQYRAYCLQGYPGAFYEDWLSPVEEEIMITDNEFSKMFGD